ncbi:Calcineurin-like metallo-phosphoesterase superfamily protein [Actinidia rufa]|uniref:Calcineurin-like metallo-phosphoesterase superfamily protein n=1 Tax=Actinidia rufa TaxID=165716 RepID=A0A7J0HE62_9ERIC|nr:Calcineurin-like metallo-phosphoesterase superfamily protein [Actinidia rufa]
MKDDDWEELMMKCVSTIRLCIADNIINNVMDEDLASALWEKLEKLYLAKSLTNKLHLKRQLYRLKMEEGGSLMEHMNVFNGYLDQLRKVDVKINEEDKALLLLTSLPDSSSFEDGESAALAVQSGNRGKKSDGRSGWSNGSSSSSRGKGVQCYYCKEFGHVKRDDCPLRKDKGKKCDDASSCNSLVVVDDGDCLTVSEEKRWWGGRYFWAMGTPCKIQGVGNVKIKMFDGAIRTLGGVVYIPKLRRNLISLSRMDSNGCKYFAGGGAMKITRGGKVLMKGEKCEGLYRLIGKTVYSTKVWKQCAQGSGYPRCESFAAKTKLCFQVADGCEGVKLVGREDGSRAIGFRTLSISLSLDIVPTSALQLLKLHAQMVYSLMLAYVLTPRHEGPEVDGMMVETDAKALSKAGEKSLGTDEKTFIRIFSERSRAHLAAVNLLTTGTLLNDSEKPCFAALQRFEHPAKADGSLSFLVIGDWGREGFYNQSEVALQFLGNHDYRGDAKAQLNPILRKIDSRWLCLRSFVLNTEIAEFFFVDTTPFVDLYFIDPEDPIYDWRGIYPRQSYLVNLLKDLELALRESNANWKIVVGHHAIRSVSHHGDTPELIDQLLPMLEANDVYFYMNGHDHCLEHINCFDSGIQYLTSGAGSKAWRGDDKKHNHCAVHYFHDGQGFMSVQLNRTDASMVFYDVFGERRYHWNASRQLHSVM